MWQAPAPSAYPARSVAKDVVVINVRFADGSVGFHNLCGWGWKGFSKMNLWRQDKDQMALTSQILECRNIDRFSDPVTLDALECKDV